jgi:DNA-binding IclR family transcriptional regulator
VFREARRPLRMKEIVDRLGYPPSSMSGLLKTMAAQNYLAFDPAARTYYPSARLAQLVSWIPAVAFESGPVAQALRNLQRATGELVVLATLDDVHVEYVEALRSTQAIQLWSPPGTRHLAVNLGLGWMFLARAPAQTADRLYRRTVELGLLSEAAFPPAALRARLAEVKDQDVLLTSANNYPSNLHPGHVGGGMVWALVPTPPNHRPLGFGIGGPADRLASNLDIIAAALRRECAVLAG